MKVRYVHKRPGQQYNPETGKLEGSPESKGGFTLAYTADSPDPVEYHPCYAVVALARCRSDEAFCRATGRHYAAKRLTEEGPTITFLIDPTRPLIEQVIEHGATLVV